MMTLPELIRNLEESVGGDAKICVHAVNLTTGDSFSHNEWRVIPTASTIKIAIVDMVSRLVAAGGLSWDDVCKVTDGALVGGSGVLRYMPSVRELSLSDAATLAIVVSDNVASNLCLEVLGGAAVATAMLRRTWDVDLTSINRPITMTPSPEDHEHTAQSTAFDLVTIASHLTADTLERMQNCTDGRMLTRWLPLQWVGSPNPSQPECMVAHKPGWNKSVRADVGIVDVLGNHVVMAVAADNLPAGFMHQGNAAEAAVATISAKVLESLVPGFKSLMKD
jgi:beta-lactamase class A